MDFEGLLNDLHKRRKFFNENFPLIKIRGKIVNKNNSEILNSCPVCGYLTLSERDTFEICPICFWEDDGLDDFNADEGSGPNHVSLVEYRQTVLPLLDKFKKREFSFGDIRAEIKLSLLQIDEYINNFSIEKADKIIDAHKKMIAIIDNYKIYGIEKLFIEDFEK